MTSFKTVHCVFVSRFEDKEGYMTFMNSFVEENIPEMKKFLDQLSVKSAFLFYC